MNAKRLNILDFATHPQFLGIQSLSTGQRALLKAIYGEELDDTEREVYFRATGRTMYHAREQNEATVIVGRRGGKTSRVAAPIACYEALRPHALARGERAYVLLIAPVTKQARIAFNYIKSYFLGSKRLSSCVLKIRRNEIELKNQITISCQPCSQVTVRGLSVVAAICDELGFWRDEATAANPAEEVIDALRPAMSTFPTSKLIKISTPYRKDGILWREFQRRAVLDHLVWQLPSPEMNPTIQDSVLQKERERNEEKFRREFKAEFTDDITSWIAAETLDACIIQGRGALPRVSSAVYAAAVDPAFKGNDFALAILHRSDGGAIVIDYVARWTGTKKAPLGYEYVCGEIAHTLRNYGIAIVVGDQYCAPVIQQEFLKLGINYREATFSARTRPDLFGNLKHLLVQRKIELPDNPELLRQLRSLEEQKAPSGNVDIRPTYGTNDDLAVAVALAARELSNAPCAPAPMVFGRIARPWDGYLPLVCDEGGGYPVGPPVCSKFPRCWDEGHCECYGF